jgi:hypothetical protein
MSSSSQQGEGLQQQQHRRRRKGLTTGVWAAGAAAALLASAAATRPASAALVYDVRLSGGGGKSVTAAVGDTVSVDVYAVVTGADATATNEGFTFGFFSLLSNNAVSGASASLNVTGGGPVAPFTSGSQVGLIQDLDGDGDLDVGKKSADAGNGNFVAPRTGTVGGEVGTGTGTAEFKLATYTLLVGPGGGGGNASFNVVLPGQGGTGTTGVAAPLNYKQDGTTVATLANVSPGTPVVISVPEPTTAAAALGGLGLLGLAAGRRRQGR